MANFFILSTKLKFTKENKSYITNYPYKKVEIKIFEKIFIL